MQPSDSKIPYFSEQRLNTMFEGCDVIWSTPQCNVETPPQQGQGQHGTMQWRHNRYFVTRHLRPRTPTHQSATRSLSCLHSFNKTLWVALHNRCHQTAVSPARRWMRDWHCVHSIDNRQQCQACNGVVFSCPQCVQSSTTGSWIMKVQRVS